MFLNTTFRGRVISNRFPELFNTGWFWPPYSPDVNPCDYFLWGYLKARVYQRNPRTIPELKAAIESEFRAIDRCMLELVVRNFVNRLEKIVVADGAHFENVK
jgi:hypothetical protein